MSRIAKLASAAALALAASFGAHATTFSLTAADYAQWRSFDVDDFRGPLFSNAWIDSHTDAGDARYLNDGSALSFTFTLASAAYLKVVDSGDNGDVFSITDNGVALGMTSTPIAPGSVTLGTTDADFNAAFASANFSSATYLLQAGSHTITGAVDPTSVAFFSTAGAIMLTPVPEPETYGMLLAGLALIGAIARRRA